MKPSVVCQPLSKFVMFVFVVSYTMPFIVFFSLNVGGKKHGEQTGAILKERGEYESPLDETMV